MGKRHLIEYWPYTRGINPNEIRINTLSELVHLGKREEQYSDLEEASLDEWDGLRNEVEEMWFTAHSRNPRLQNTLMINIKGISDNGREINANFSTYKTSFWLKRRLSQLPIEKQEALAKKFALLSIGMVVVTSDNYIMIEQRPEGVPAPLMYLNYPCGNVERDNKTLAETVNLESKEELGFEIFDSSGNLLPFVKDIYSLGLERESDEWTPCYSFVTDLDITVDRIKATHDVPNVLNFPANPEELTDSLIKLYSPTTKGNHIDVRGRLVPNATAMLALYIRDKGGEELYKELNGKLSSQALKQGYEFEVREYTHKTNPFT